MVSKNHARLSRSAGAQARQPADPLVGVSWRIHLHVPVRRGAGPTVLTDLASTDPALPCQGYRRAGIKASTEWPWPRPPRQLLALQRPQLEPHPQRGSWSTQVRLPGLRAYCSPLGPQAHPCPGHVPCLPTHPQCLTCAAPVGACRGATPHPPLTPHSRKLLPPTCLLSPW